jgi:GT2 family glycosyltransferase
VLAEAAIPPDGISVLRLSEHTGPAGGQAAALREFLHRRYDLAWVFDDYCVPDSNCLGHLLKERAKSPEAAVLFPTQWANGIVHNYPGWFGSLIPRTIVETVGLPYEPLFWWTEDTEYLRWRIPRAGYSVRWVADANVNHLEARRMPRRPTWKFYYEARN